jgi:hypothetical protein
MTNDQLRDLVRRIVADRLGERRAASEPPLQTGGAAAAAHASHAMYVSVVNVGEACVIEPDVLCNHCGYCKSHGH